MKVAVLFSGGKDSTYALKKAFDSGWDVGYMITLIPEKDDSWMFHHPCIELTRLQSESIGIKHLVKNTSGNKESELEDLNEVLAGIRDDIDALVSGAISSNYQKDRIDTICADNDIESVTPLWGLDQSELVKDQIEYGLDIIFSGVSSAGLDETWLFRKLDDRALGDLERIHDKYGINIAGEGGEYETFVKDAPFFSKNILIEDFEKKWDNETGSGYIICKKAKLLDKVI